MLQSPTTSNQRFVRVSLRQLLDGLWEQVVGSGTVVGFVQARELLEAVHMTTEEFSLAVNRLTNAQHYLRSGEIGAARFELRLLRQSLAK